MATIVEHVCGECGCIFGMEEGYIEARRSDHRTWYCPNGHPRAFLGKSKEEKLREELASERRRRQSAEQNIAYYADEAKRERHRANGYKGHATRLTKRVKAGVCICCNRSFKDLARHMASKHPTLTPLTPLAIEQDAPEGATVQ